MHSGLLKLIRITELNEKVIGIFIRKIKIDKMGNKAGEFVEDQIRIRLEIVFNFLFLYLKHPFQLSKTLFEYIFLLFWLLNNLRLVTLLFSPLGILDLHIYRVLDAFSPVLGILPDSVVRKYASQKGLPMIMLRNKNY